ncbi:hypothetical protein Tco_1338579 [Tanacetum coccineum]
MDNNDSGVPTLRSCLKATKVRSIDGKILGKDGKPMKPVRHVSMAEKENVSLDNCNISVDIGATNSVTFVDATNDVMGSVLAASRSDPNGMSSKAFSFASVVQNKVAKKVVKVKELQNSEKIGWALLHSLKQLQINTWCEDKYGLKRIQLHEEFFLFQFDTKEGMESVMEHGPWLIRRMPLMLNVWTPNTDLKKDDIKCAHLWVKLHHVPIVAYSEGRSTYARILIEVLADKDLMDSMVVAIPLCNGKGHTFATIDIEYEWRPPRCSVCEIFDHNLDKCPKTPKAETMAKVSEDGFTEVKRKKNKAKQNQNPRHIDGIRLTKPPPNFYYRKVEKGETSKMAAKDDKVKEKNKEQVDQMSKEGNVIPKAAASEVQLKNSFSSLGDGETDWEGDGPKLNVINESDSEDIDDELIMEASWNIRGLNFSPKQSEVRHVISENNLSICAILESHVLDSNLMKLCPYVFNHWNWTSNGNCCSKGTRIILGWNHNDVDIVVLNQDDQAIHVRVWLKLECKELFCTFVYAHNRYTQRRLLWENLRLHKHYVRDRPWCILGDFNAALFLHDSLVGNLNIDISMREFKECVEDLEVMDVQHSGLQFTWSQKPKGKEGLLKKIDRVMANLIFNEKFAGSHAIFKPYRISDHAPSVLRIPTVTKPKPKPFKFYNLITCNENFKKVVMDGWSMQISGFHMFRVAKKLKLLKKPLRKLLYDKAIREEEAMVLAAFNEACIMKEKFLKQIAKIDWLREGDSNSAYFQKSGEESSKIFLGQPGSTTGFCDNDLFQNSLEENVALEMTRMVTREEVKSALFSMGNEKSPGPDGFSAAFFKEAWDIVADDFVAAVCEFFTNGKILRELNHTIIALIPKVSSPTRVNDYRMLSCCNVIFKCISKIIANRIKESLKVLVSPNQSAFVLGRSIADNILLTQELMHNYHLDRGPPRCAFKVDIQKAYDTVDWGFLKNILAGFGFHTRMIGWIMECVTTTSFSVCINGSLHGFFKGKRGLRQGDPLSPYLFTLVMEILTLMLQRGVRNANSFTYHRYCSRMELINLCFADDLFLFAHGDTDSVRVIKEALVEFKEASGLVSSLPKSKAYFCNVINFTKLAILQILTFEEGCLPVKYLGVPLVTSRLVFRDCKELIEKVQARVDDWKNKFLSVAGRLQLIRSVLSSMHIYWASMFIMCKI